MKNLFRFTSSNTVAGVFSHLKLQIKDFHAIPELKPTALNKSEIEYMLEVQQLQQTWKTADNSIQREIKFKDFKEAFSFMNQIAILADMIEHHPEWENVYDRVTINLSTHDCQGVSVKDIILAHAIDTVALNIKFKSAETVQDTRSLEIGRIGETWNSKFTNHQKLAEAQASKA